MCVSVCVYVSVAVCLCLCVFRERGPSHHGIPTLERSFFECRRWLSCLCLLWRLAFGEGLLGWTCLGEVPPSFSFPAAPCCFCIFEVALRRSATWHVHEISRATLAQPFVVPYCSRRCPASLHDAKLVGCSVRSPWMAHCTRVHQSGSDRLCQVRLLAMSAATSLNCRPCVQHLIWVQSSKIGHKRESTSWKPARTWIKPRTTEARMQTQSRHDVSVSVSVSVLVS